MPNLAACWLGLAQTSLARPEHARTAQGDIIGASVLVVFLLIGGGFFLGLGVCQLVRTYRKVRSR